ncbi:hypothetical protein AOLE_07495 [Acinetobacter oleivorans DR1]|uniref:Uncharacterized protein n=2 Tax=Acinetobacter oleivorans TaxID=1148157 RepID=A0AAN0UCT5_ACISD|nr:hypothetical protein AOLE_07495 [Acinetobacter oleivorans DR1]
MNDMKNKLIVDRNQAKEIRNKDICQIVVNMRIRDGANNQNRATKKFLNQVFWVAEPLCSIKCGQEKFYGHFSCDPIPEGWSRYTLDRSGSRVNFGEHRFLVECTEVKEFSYSAGKLFSVLLTLKKVNGGAL